VHNFDDLQKRCKRYRVKQALKYILVIFILPLAVAFSFFFIIGTKPPLKVETVVKKSIKKPSQQKTKKIPVVQKTKKATIVQTKIKQKEHPPISKKDAKKVDATKKTYSLQFLVAQRKNIKQINKKKRFLESLGFKECKLVQSVVYIHLVCNESNSLDKLQSYIELAKRNHIDYVIRRQSYKITDREIATPKKEKREKKQEKKKEIPVETEKAPTSMLKVKNTNLEQLQKKFSQAPNYNIAITIASNYYKKEAFKNAIIWAKKANELDKSDAKSWIIYAKSLHAIHQNNKARQLLHIYLQYENSEEVSNLLQNWEKNQ